MNETLEQETVEEISEYKLTFENTTESEESAEAVVKNQILNEDDAEAESGTPSEECTALVTLKERRLLAAQTMFKKSIKVSIKSFLISISLSFLNLFI